MAKKTTKPKARRATRRVVAAAAKTASRPTREKPASRRATDDSQVAVAESLRGKYVYCVIQSADSLKFGAAGIGDNGTEIHTVHYRDLAAVVSDVPLGVLVGSPGTELEFAL